MSVLARLCVCVCVCVVYLCTCVHIYDVLCVRVWMYVRVCVCVLYFGACLRVSQDSQDLETVFLNVPTFFSFHKWCLEIQEVQTIGHTHNKFKMHACTIIVTSTSHNHSAFHFRLLKEYGLSYSHLCLFQGWGILPILQPRPPPPQTTFPLCVRLVPSHAPHACSACSSLRLLICKWAQAIASTSAEPFLHGSACGSVSGTPGKWISIFLLRVWWDRILTRAI